MRLTRWPVVLLAWAIALDTASAQVVRGTMTERVTGLPLAGVLVSVASERDSGSVRHTLTNLRGEYALRSASVMPPQ